MKHKKELLRGLWVVPLIIVDDLYRLKQAIGVPVRSKRNMRPRYIGEYMLTLAVFSRAKTRNR